MNTNFYKTQKNFLAGFGIAEEREREMWNKMMAAQQPAANTTDFDEDPDGGEWGE